MLQKYSTNAACQGAVWTSLAPTAIGLAIYFCLADIVLIAQCTYYNTLNARRRSRSHQPHHHHHHRHRHNSNSNPRTSSTGSSTLAGDGDGDGDAGPAEDSPLLGRRSSSLGLPGSHRRHSTHARQESSEISLTRIITGEDDRPDSHPWLNNALSLGAVWVVGVAGWFVSYKMGAWDVEPGLPEQGETTSKFGLALGYLSAAAYLWYVTLRLPPPSKPFKLSLFGREAPR